MTTGPRPSAENGTARSSGRPIRTVLVGVIVLALVGVGWFVMSWRVMHTPAGDAGGEAFGVIFGLLIVVSVVGAIRNPSRRGHEGS